MNIVKELRKKAGIQQKELALIAGVSNPTVSEWENGKKDPSGERLRKLAEYFGVDELVILGRGIIDLSQAQAEPPKTQEARTLAAGVDRMTKEERERVLKMVKLMFEHADYFERNDDDGSPT